MGRVLLAHVSHELDKPDAWEEDRPIECVHVMHAPNTVPTFSEWRISTWQLGPKKMIF